MSEHPFWSDPDLRPPVTVERTDDSSITTDGWTLGWDFERRGPVEVGDEVVFAGGMGHVVRGAAVNGEVRYYESLSAWQDRNQAEREAKERKERIEFYLRDPLQSSGDPYHHFLLSYHSLPEPFQRRIQKFVGERDDWIRRFGAYEMSACLDAVKVGEWFIEHGATEENWKLWTSPETQPFKLWGGHSGNSFGMAVRLGYLYAGDPQDVILEHGAMVGLTGCEEYGCPHPLVPTP